MRYTSIDDVHMYIRRYISFIKLERLTRNAIGNCFVNKLNALAVKARVLCADVVVDFECMCT